MAAVPAKKERSLTTGPEHQKRAHHQALFANRLDLDEMLAVETQLGDGFANVVQRQVRAAFLEFQLGRPARGQLLERRDVQIAVVEVVFQGWHALVEEAAILADAVAAD